MDPVTRENFRAGLMHGLRSARGLDEASAGSPPPELMRLLAQPVRSLSFMACCEPCRGAWFSCQRTRPRTGESMLPRAVYNRGGGPPNERASGPKIDRRKYLGAGGLTHQFCDLGRRCPSDQHPLRSIARHCVAPSRAMPGSCTTNSRANRPASSTMTVRTPFPRP